MKNKPEHEVVGKIIFRADVENTSPLLIATGKGEEIDFEVIRDRNGKPIIPASGFAGMLKNSFENLSLNEEEKKTKTFFWGSDDTKSKTPVQSHIIIDDLKLKDENFSILERDGVEINKKTGTAEDESKYDYELIEPGAVFNLNMEITIRKNIDTAILKNFLYFIAENGKNKLYQQGAFKSNGFGILEFKNFEIFEFNFPDDANTWFNFLTSDTSTNTYDNTIKSSLTINKNILTITGCFSIKNSLIIRSKVFKTTSGNEQDPDHAHLKNSKGIALLTAKSVRGAVRHRALKILNTLNCYNSDEIVNGIFGNVDKEKQTAQKGRLKTFEQQIKNVEQTQVQSRIKIDRFTGGTIKGALMQTQSLWHKEESFELKFEIENCKDYEVGLMLLVMKDLMHEDLAIGGEKAIGRGVLKGKEIKISGKVEITEVKEFDIEFDDKGIKKEYLSEINTINNWISAINKN